MKNIAIVLILAAPLVATPLMAETLAVAGQAAAADTSAAPSFRRDVMPILFRAGCNGGACHGSARGKDGFMLSLFGFDPKGDYARIVDEMPSRRVNVAAPEQSLLLLKAIGSVPHTGGKLFDADSELYKTLLRWIEEGAPDDAGPVPEVVGISLNKKGVVFEKTGGRGRPRVTAQFSDNTSRDVTHLARFFSNNPSVASIDADGTVTANGPGDTNIFARYSRFTVGAEVVVLPDESEDGTEKLVWPNPPFNNFIDSLVFERLEKLRIAPSGLCNDETFLRRVTLDLVARPPTVEEYHAFMADSAPDKRSKRIDALLASDAFADYQTTLWAEQLRTIGSNYAPYANHVKAADTFFKWIRTQMRSDRPLDEFVAEMIAASGSNISNGPANLYTMMVQRAKLDPKAFAADCSQVFLGVQIQCAECHNHPFDRWSMDDYYGFVSFFTGVSRKNGPEPRDKRIYWDPKAPPARHLLDGRPMPAKVLGGAEPVAGEEDPRKALAAWMTSPDNELFSRNLANRIWAQFFGRGVADPVDDVRASNPPVNEPLLDALSKRLVESKFSLRSLVRDICNSRVYQLSSTPNPSNVRDIRQFSHAYLRRLRADVLLDSIVAVTDVPRPLPGFARGTRAIDFYPRNASYGDGPQYGDPFFETFGRSSRATICACETKREPTLSQALHMAVGDTTRDRLAAGGVVKKLVETKSTPEGIIEELYIRTLCRQPSGEEMAGMRSLVADRAKDQAVYEDIFWGLLSSTEFAFSH